jgi:hypothetical protein
MLGGGPGVVLGRVDSANADVDDVETFMVAPRGVTAASWVRYQNICEAFWGLRAVESNMNAD